MATNKINTNPNLVHVQLTTDTGECHTIEANQAGEFIIPAKEYRVYSIVEEKPEAIFQFSPTSRAYLISPCMGVCRG